MCDSQSFVSDQLKKTYVSACIFAFRCHQFADVLTILDCFDRSGKSTDNKGFGAAKPIQQAKQVSNEDKKWQLEAYDIAEWIEWLDEQKKQAGVKGEHVFVQIQLDGTVRSSGLGSPPWEKFLDDLAPLDDIRTRFTDGLGR